MMNVCYNCGEYRADKIIDPGGPYAICPICGYKHAFIQAPLLFVCGPSGAGKSTLCQTLAGKMDEVVMLDGDVLWRPEFATQEDNFRDFFETWLRLSKNISQSGRPVVLFIAGAIPENVEPCVERSYFSQVHYLALVCDDEVLAERLRRRPRWRQSNDERFIAEQLRFNRWLTQRGSRASPPIELIETSGESVEKSVEKVAGWIREKVL
jgi:ribose 1,5-bisphosphokinase PhnN